jgi:hypothetical protein
MDAILEELIDKLIGLRGKSPIANGDLSDLGNEIGIVIGQYTNDKMGYDKEDFIVGVRHGISISEGTHGF